MTYQDIKDLKPKIVGKARRESFGGLYYERRRLIVEMMNDIAYHIISLCNGENTVENVKQSIMREYRVSEDILENDLAEYVHYLLNSGFITMDGIETAKANNIVLKPMLEENEIKQNRYSLGTPPFTLSAPMKVLLELTHNCNLKCVHCMADATCKITSKGYLDGELDTNAWYQIIDQIFEAEVFEILLSGGEPTLRNDFIDIAKYIHSKGATYCLLSNTTLIDMQLAKQLKETGCNKVESNLDGYNDDTYDDFRGVKGSFKKTVEGIKACLANDIPVRCNVMETKKTVIYLKEIVDFAYSIGVREVCVVPLEQGGRAKGNMELAFNKSDIEKLTDFYIEVNDWFEKKYGNSGMVLLTPYTLQKRSGSRYSKIFDLNNFIPSCGAGKIHCTIDPYGDVKLCPSDANVLKRERLNLLEKSLKDIWESSETLMKARGTLRSECVTCQNFECTNRCPVQRLDPDLPEDLKTRNCLMDGAL